MIEVENLTKVFVDTPAVDDVSFFVPEGQVLGFLGPNGAGKTTTMRMITGFLPPSSGRVIVAGEDLDRNPVAMRRKIGYLPENVPLYPEMRVQEYLRFRAEVEEIPRSKIAGNLNEVLERCLIEDVSNQIIGTLSKGFRQRVGLASALIHKPPVLILDEPTVGLDPNQIIKIRELITELGRDHTVLLSTHILPEVDQVCERVFIIDQGKIVADGTPDALRTRLVGNPAVQIELKGAGEDAAGKLLNLPGVTEVVPENAEGRFRIVHENDSDPREDIFHLTVNENWIMRTMAPEKATLEDVFVRLTTKETTSATGEEV